MKSHKSACNDIDNTSKLYEYIRNNDGFDNWNFEILEQCREESKQDRLIKEATYIKALKSKLNTNIPGTTYIDREARYYCGRCCQLLKGPARSVTGVKSHHKSNKCKTAKGFNVNPINIIGDNNVLKIIYHFPE